MKMPGISIVEFLAETKDDFNSPTTSTFTAKMAMCRSTISALEESLDADRSALKKMKNAVKAMYNSGSAHCTNEEIVIENLDRLGGHSLNAREPEPDIAAAFMKLAVFTRELSSLLKNLVTNINNIVMFPLDSLLKGDLKGIKGDMKRPFDKSWKDYDTKVKQVEREKRQLAKEAGMIRNEITGGEIAEEMEKERRMFQLQMCEYLIKANEIKTKKGVDLLQHLVDYYHAQNTFFSEGCRVTEHFKSYANELSNNLHSIRQSQDEERRQLVELRNLLRTAVGDSSNASKSGPSVYNLHQLQGLKEFGNEKVGSLMKRSEGLRKAWQKRKCTVSDGFLTISHNNMSKPPVKLNLLTSQVKPVPEDKKIFDLVSHNRTYRFMADDEAEAMAWVSVISNSKEDALNRVFGEEGGSKQQNSGLKELTKSILDEVKHLPGNDRCCDCGAQDPTWLSTNLGVLTCIECSGIHRDMGVHISRIQSITLDELGTSELLLARAVGNAGFNDIMEAKLDLIDKPKPSSDMETRKSFIRDKYEMHRYAMHICLDDPARLQEELLQAVQSREIYALLQVFAEGVDLSSPLPGYNNGETALHLAITQEDRSTLFIVDFLVQNASQGLNKQTINDGNTPLHLCAELNKTECMKLLLRTRAKTDIRNNAGETAFEIAKRTRNSSCEELLAQAASGKFHPIVHVDVDWNFSFMEEDDDFDFPPDNSDDDVEERNEKSATLGYNSPYKPGPVPTARNRPVSAINPGMPVTAHSSAPDNLGRLRPTSFKDRPRPPGPHINHSLSPSAPQPPPRPDKGPIVPSPNVAGVNRNRSRTVAPTASLKEHKRTSSDTRHPPGSNAPSNSRNISNALETILQNRGPPPPLPPHHNPPSNPSASRATQPLPPVPIQQDPPRRDSFSNESSAKSGTQPPSSKSRNQPHHSFSIINSIQNALKSQSKNSRRSLDPHFKPGSGARNPATLPANHALKTSKSQSTNKKNKRRSGNFTLTLTTTTSQAMLSSRSLESLLSTPKPSSAPYDTHDLSFQSLCASPRATHVTSNAKVVSPHSPPISGMSYINPSYSFQSLPVYANCDPSTGIYDNNAASGLADLRTEISTTVSNTRPSLLATHSQSFPAALGRTAFTNLQSTDGGGGVFGVQSQSFHLASSFNQSSFNPVTMKQPPQTVVQPPSPAPPALPDKLATRELPPPPLPRSSGSSGSRPQRVKAIYDCEADNQDELTFVEDEIIVVTGVEDQEWWVGHVEHQPHRSGVFPVSFVHFLPE